MAEVSVLMGAHNAGRWLAASVASVRAQAFSDWELVLVDNGSTDGAADRLAAETSDARIRLLRFDRALGPGGALAEALRAASGRYLAILNADDLAHPARLERQRAYLELNGDVGVLGSGSEMIDEHDAVIGPEQFAGRHEEIHALSAFLPPLRHSSLMCRRAVCEQVPYREIASSADDMDFLARAAERFRLAALPDTLCRYRSHPANLTHRSAVPMAAAGGLVRMLTRRRRRGRPEEAERWHAVFTAIGREAPGLRAAHLAMAGLFKVEGWSDLAAMHLWLAARAGSLMAWPRLWWLGLGGLVRRPGALRALTRAWGKEPVHQFLRSEGYPERWQF